MYYILNIKANNSEFILESAERLIIEKEMDAYFACFFNASTEFKSKIKKVELKNDNLVSIEEIGTKKITDNKKVISMDDTFVNASKPLNTNNEEEVIDYEKTLKFLDEDDDDIATLDKQSQDNIAKLMDYQEDDELIEIEKEPTSFLEAPTQTESEHEIIIEHEKDSNPSFIAPSKEEAKKIEEICETKGNDIIFPDEDLIFEDEKTQSPISNEPVLKASSETAIILDKIFEKQAQEESLLTQETLIPRQQEIKQPTANNENKDASLDFKLFLASYLIFDLSNQFMACAFYIKNILKQDSFTLKEINAKLIKAIGTIANMKIVSELNEKNYIDFKEEDSIKKYSITPLGEEYFVSKYQG